jgi:serine/threonine-protein kinase
MTTSDASMPQGLRAPSLGEGRTLGVYRIVRHLGTGGMAEVYEGMHVGLRKRVAIKVLKAEMAANSDVRRRFLYEGQAASRIRHPHVVDVTDVADGEVPFLVMELLEGRTLQGMLDGRTRLPLGRAVDILLPILAALAEAHNIGVIHRDLKPDNVFLARTSQGRVVPKLLDFGISKVIDDLEAKNTATSSVLGTPHYMSPEQAAGEKFLDARSDQFSAAMILYECITGGLPYKADTIVGLIHEVARCELRPPSDWDPTLPKEIDGVLMRGLAKDPGDRYDLIEDFAEALLPFATERGSKSFDAARHAALIPLSEFPPPPSAGPASGVSKRSPDAALGASGKPAQPSLGPPTLDGPRSPAAVVVDTSSPPTPAPAVAPVSTSMPTPVSAPIALEEPKRSRAPVVIAVIAILLLILAAVPAALFFLAKDEVAAPGPAVTTASPPSTFAVRTSATPPAARFELDGRELGTGPIALELPLDGASHRLIVSADGYVSRDIVFRDASPPATIDLEAVPAEVQPVEDRPEPTPMGERPRMAGMRVEAAEMVAPPTMMGGESDIRLER